MRYKNGYDLSLMYHGYSCIIQSHYQSMCPMIWIMTTIWIWTLIFRTWIWIALILRRGTCACRVCTSLLSVCELSFNDVLTVQLEQHVVYFIPSLRLSLCSSNDCNLNFWQVSQVVIARIPLASLQPNFWGSVYLSRGEDPTPGRLSIDEVRQVIGIAV